MDLKYLKKEIPFQWKIQSFNKEKTWGSVVAYIDARDVMDLLDEVVKPENWKDDYIEVGTRLICRLSIKCDTEWVSKSDTGTEAEGEEEKSLVSDAFKRAAVKWGIGRFLYRKDIKWVEINEYKQPIDDNGKRIYDLSKYINDGGGYKMPFRDKKPQQTQTNISQTHTNPHEEEFKKTLEEGKCEKCGIKISENVKRFSLKAYNVERCMQCQKELINNK